MRIDTYSGRNVAACSGKRAYGSRPEAQKAADRIKDRTNQSRASAYACAHCGAFHIGRARGNAGKPQEMRA